MITLTPTEEKIITQIRQLSPDAMQKLEKFIDQFSQPQNNPDQFLTLTASKLSESVLAKIWNNVEDAEYDKF